MPKVFKEYEHEKKFKEDGFFSFPLLNDFTLAQLRVKYQKLIPSFFNLGFHSTMHHSEPEYRKMVDMAIKEIIEPLIEGLLHDYRVLFSNFIVKEPSADSQVGIHQDWNYLDEDRFSSVNIWCPLVDITSQNGGFFVLPGSHLLKSPPRFTPYQMPGYMTFAEQIKENAHSLDLKAGHAIVYQSGIIHFSEPNLSKEVRPAIGFVSIPKSAEPWHYFYNGDKLEIYALDENFYYDIEIGRPPQNANKIQEIELDETCFGLEEMKNLIRKNSSIAK